LYGAQTFRQNLQKITKTAQRAQHVALFTRCSPLALLCAYKLDISMATVQPMWYAALARLYVERVNDHNTAGIEELCATPCSLKEYHPNLEGFDDYFSNLEDVHHDVSSYMVPKVKGNNVLIDYQRLWIDKGQTSVVDAQDALTFDEHGLIVRVAYSRRPVLQSKHERMRRRGGSRAHPLVTHA
jgi:hypothetical protein